MLLTPGTRLGSYEIAATVGKGGMGEVYRATDLKLKREVALKVLPAALTHDQARMARFQREAEVLASLNHPNIAQIYGLEEADGVRAIVMELVEGETLADIIKRGPIPVETAIAYAKQIAGAFEYAHDKSKPVIHRDLKPANVQVTPDGVVKVLDFGLAKAMSEDTQASTADPVNSPTLTMGPTVVGMILGTAAYMSPEQAKGKSADRRSDIWSFGVTLYEMVTGRPLFTGAEIGDILAAIVLQEPKLDDVPARLRPAIERCIRKDPRKRWYSMEDVRFALDEPEQARAVMPGISAEAATTTARGNRISWAAAAFFAVLAAGLGVTLWPRTEPLKPLVRLEVDLGANVALLPQAGQHSVAISPDGARLVYVASVAGAPSRLFTRRLDQAKAAELPGTEGGTNPFFSPDGQWVVFQAGGKASKISVEGGAVVPLTDAVILAGADWGEDGTILLGGAINGGMRRVPSSGGQAAKLTDLGNGEIANAAPQFLPGGKFALLSVIPQVLNVDADTIEAISLSDLKRKVVWRGGTSPRYLPSGHLVYANKSTLFAIPFDAEKLETYGNALPILDDVLFNPQTYQADLSFSNNGTLVYRRGGAGVGSGQMTMQWIDAAGKRSPLLAKAGVYGTPRFSPDGKRVVLGVAEGGSLDIWVYDPQRDAMDKRTFGGAVSANPVWTPDGRFVVFNRAGMGLAWTRADGAGQPQALIESKAILVPTSVSPDGKHLAFFEVGAADGWLHSVEITEEGGSLKAGKPVRLFESKFIDTSAEFSPDGRWIAYQTNESGQIEIVVRAFPPAASGQGGKWQVSTNGGTAPRWSRSELLYLSGDRIMAVSYTVNGDSFVADKPGVKIEKAGGAWWDLAPDGRIAVLTPVESAQAPAADHTVVFLQNFFDELKRRVPVN